MTSAAQPPRWRDSIAVYRDRRMVFIFFFGIASGLPSSLVFATLSIWLREEGLSRTAIGMLGIVATPYAINFLWAPLVDRLRLPALGALGQRRLDVHVHVFELLRPLKIANPYLSANLVKAINDRFFL